MDGVLIKPLGQVAIKEPENWCTIADLSTAWIKMQEGSIQEILQTRVCAAAIGIVFDNERNKVQLPAYDWSRGNIYVYGATIEDRLLRQGVKVNQICLGGVTVFRWLQDLIPTPEDVENATDFTEAEEANKTLSV